MNADIVFQMDADFSHNPNEIPHFIDEILLKGNDFVIGSRYTSGGSIPCNWSFIRKINSKVGNTLARHIAGMKTVKDCTSGYRAINTTLLKKIDLDSMNVKGYAFLVSLLYQAFRQKAIISEIPIQFVERKYGKSKIQFSDISEFLVNVIFLRYPILKNIQKPHFRFICLLFIFVILIIISLFLSFKLALILIIYGLSTFLILQSCFNIYCMLYAWEDIDRIENEKPPTQLEEPHFSFTAIIPARHEENVIKETIRAINNIDYPENKKEIIIVCRYDDTRTISPDFRKLVS